MSAPAYQHRAVRGTVKLGMRADTAYGAGSQEQPGQRASFRTWFVRGQFAPPAEEVVVEALLRGGEAMVAPAVVE
jgi:hypothetical protein